MDNTPSFLLCCTTVRSATPMANLSSDGSLEGGSFESTLAHCVPFEESSHKVIFTVNYSSLESLVTELRGLPPTMQLTFPQHRLSELTIEFLRLEVVKDLENLVRSTVSRDLMDIQDTNARLCQSHESLLHVWEAAAMPPDMHLKAVFSKKGKEAEATWLNLWAQHAEHWLAFEQMRVCTLRGPCWMLVE